jgi:DNA helicase-2/ATP-dependent DNA helicase PcrA
MEMEYSQYQQAIFRHAEDPHAGNAIVEAVAGSGKTTTLVETIKRLKGNSIFLAFNKSIADELKKRGVNARTFHSLCFSPVLRARNAHDVTQNKLRRIVDAKCTGEDAKLYGTYVIRMVGLARQVGIGCLVPDKDEAWYDIIEHHDLQPDDENASIPRAIEIAQKVLAFSSHPKQNMIDFDDMLYLAVRDGISLPKFDNVLVDEAQDTNAIQRAILRKIMHPGTRLIAVGDPAQAIYGFRGADSNSMNLIAQEFNCKTLPLSISYRCAQSVVHYAQQWVNHIEAAPNAPEGAVTSFGTEWDHNVFTQGDLVVSRTTRPMVALAFNLIRNKVSATIMGRDIGEGLKKLIDKMNAGENVDLLVEKLNTYTQREAEKALAKKEEAKAEQIYDKTAAIVTLCEGLNEDERTVTALKRTVDSLFDNPNAAVKCATIHKAKGLEADRVFWLNRSLCPAMWARQEWQKQQEVNLCYVAATRAKKELVLIEEKV